MGRHSGKLAYAGLAALLPVITAVIPAFAAGVGDFYRGRQVEIVISMDVGGENLQKGVTEVVAAPADIIARVNDCIDPQH